MKLCKALVLFLGACCLFANTTIVITILFSNTWCHGVKCCLMSILAILKPHLCTDFDYELLLLPGEDKRPTMYLTGWKGILSLYTFAHLRDWSLFLSFALTYFLILHFLFRYRRMCARSLWERWNMHRSSQWLSMSMCSWIWWDKLHE